MQPATFIRRERAEALGERLLRSGRIEDYRVAPCADRGGERGYRLMLKLDALKTGFVPVPESAMEAM